MWVRNPSEIAVNSTLLRKVGMTTPARIYVGTYAKYNNGSIDGVWLDLDDYANKLEFEAACQKLHGSGEHEFVFQDHEGIPAEYLSKSYLSADVWDERIVPDDDASVRFLRDRPFSVVRQMQRLRSGR